ncbi:MAG: dihydroorotate dehydrogenase-like protein [Bacteroidales bacterium]|nr:dihydroorotate dehydrogenase-like protein [Bacteroidales bacterium]
MDLSTEYMGLKLKNPIIVSSSKLTSELDTIKKCADVGAGAIVLKSLFEEQLIADSSALMDQDIKYFWFPEAIEHINKHSKEHGLKQVLDLIKKTKDHTDIPIIASINCLTAYEWPKFAKTLQDAGADGIELNIAIFPFDKFISSKEVEDQYVEIVTEVKKHVTLPISVKLSNYFTNITQITNRLDEVGINGLVIFNRLYRPDIDIETEKVVRENVLSSPLEITKALRWVALLAGSLNCNIAGGTGIHDYKGVVKHLLAGAHATQICSTLFNNGISYIDTILFDLEKWMKKHKYNSIAEFRGKICRQENECNNKFERIQYLKQEIYKR